jgi:hypothetical protein
MLLKQAFRAGIGGVAGAMALLGAVGMAAAQDRATVTDRFWVQENPLGVVSTDVLAQDRRFLGGLGYGVNLAPPRLGSSAGSGFDLSDAGNEVSLQSWHFGVDMLQPTGTGRPGSAAQLVMGYGGQLGDGLAFSVGPTVSMGGDGTASLFGANAGGGFAHRFSSDTGVRDYGLRGAATYSLGESWALTGVLGYRRTLGELGLNANDDQFYSILGLGYRF